MILHLSPRLAPKRISHPNIGRKKTGRQVTRTCQINLVWKGVKKKYLLRSIKMIKAARTSRQKTTMTSRWCPKFNDHLLKKIKFVFNRNQRFKMRQNINKIKINYKIKWTNKISQLRKAKVRKPSQISNQFSLIIPTVRSRSILSKLKMSTDQPEIWARSEQLTKLKTPVKSTKMERVKMKMLRVLFFPFTKTTIVIV